VKILALSTNSNRPVTQSDLARALRLSQYAVSLALRNSPTISEAQRKRVQGLAQQMGYCPNPAASALRSLQNSNIATGEVREALAWLNFWPDKRLLRSWGEFDRYWQGAEACAKKFGYRLEEFSGSGMTLKRLEQQLRARGIQGILLPPHGGLSLDLRKFGWEHFSVVRFGTTIEQPAVHTVGADTVANVICAFNAMRERGYRRIGFVGYPVGSRLTLHAYLGSQQLVPPEERLTPFCMSGATEEVRKIQNSFTAWLDQQRPDAILTEVTPVPDMLNRAGWRVPQDVALASTTIVDIPQITAGIDQNPWEIGRVAVLVLISQLRDHDRGVPTVRRDIRVEGKWVDGRSLPGRSVAPKKLPPQSQ
jgi:DNA-binding LacI/PurR family transcriptional regulator